MFLKLRITFTILSALCLAVVIPAAVWGGWVWFTLLAAGALFFFALMLVCKQSQEREEEKKTPKQEEPDFISAKSTPKEK